MQSLEEVTNDMFVKVKYFGLYPLGSDVCFGQVFYTKDDKRTVFFVAIEYGLGHYHIFSINDKTQQKLLHKVGSKLL